MIKFERDKMIHTVVGAVVGVMAFKFIAPVAFPTLILIAVGKEVYDYFNQDKQTPDVVDALCTIAGGTTAMYAMSMF